MTNFTYNLKIAYNLKIYTCYRNKTCSIVIASAKPSQLFQYSFYETESKQKNCRSTSDELGAAEVRCTIGRGEGGGAICAGAACACVCRVPAKDAILVFSDLIAKNLIQMSIKAIQEFTYDTLTPKYS